MSERNDWQVVLNDTVEERPLIIERHDPDGFYRVLARQNRHDEGIAYQEGDDYVHVGPASKGEKAEGEASTRHALRQTLEQLHFSSAAVDRVMQRVDNA